MRNFLSKISGSGQRNKTDSVLDEAETGKKPAPAKPTAKVTPKAPPARTKPRG